MLMELSNWASPRNKAFNFKSSSCNCRITRNLVTTRPHKNIARNFLSHLIWHLQDDHSSTWLNIYGSFLVPSWSHVEDLGVPYLKLKQNDDVGKSETCQRCQGCEVGVKHVKGAKRRVLWKLVYQYIQLNLLLGRHVIDTLNLDPLKGIFHSPDNDKRRQNI